MIWFSQEEAEALEAQLESLRGASPELIACLRRIEDAELPDEFLESWR